MGHLDSRGDFSWEGGVPSPKVVINLPRTYERLHCKDVFISSLVSKILPHTQTDRQTDGLRLYYKALKFNIRTFIYLDQQTVPPRGQ